MTGRIIAIVCNASSLKAHLGQSGGPVQYDVTHCALIVMQRERNAVLRFYANRCRYGRNLADWCFVYRDDLIGLTQQGRAMIIWSIERKVVISPRRSVISLYRLVMPVHGRVCGWAKNTVLALLRARA